MPRKRILVVDDDSSVRQLYCTALAMAGFAVNTAEDGLDALRQIDDEPPDAVVLDLELPRVGGLDVLGDLRAHSGTSDIPVVIVTGSDVQSIEQASAFFHKPCEPEDLISTLEEQFHTAA